MIRFRHGTFLEFTSQYDGMEVWEAAKLRTITHENSNLKRFLTGPIQDNALLKGLLGMNLQIQLNNRRLQFGRCGILIS